MKIAALAPRTISFSHEKPCRSVAGIAVTFKPVPMAVPYVEKRVCHLTPRELEVLALLCEGLSNKHISRRLDISAGTVKIHVGKILSALCVTSRLQAVVAAQRKGLAGGSVVGATEQALDDVERRFPSESYALQALHAA